MVSEAVCVLPFTYGRACFEVKVGQWPLVGACNRVRAVAPLDTVPSSQLLLIKVVLTTNSVCGWQGPDI